MKKPYIICHMMISLDGRIDCAMTVICPVWTTTTRPWRR